MRREKLEAELDFYCMRCKLVSFPGLPTVHFCSLPVFTYWKQSKTGRWEGLRMMLLQIRPILTSYLLLRPNSTIDSLRQIVILQLYRHEARSAAIHIACMPKPIWSRLQTTSRKWFTNQFANRFLNQFSSFTPAVSKPVQQTLCVNAAQEWT